MLSRCKNLDQVFLDESFIREKHLKVHPESLVEARKIEDNCIAAKLKKERFDIFFVNMRAKSNFLDIIHDPFAMQSSLVCLVQTGLETNEVFQWPGRRCMPHASSGYGKGVCCLTDEKQNTLFRTRLVREHFQLMKVTMRDKFQIFVVYISPNQNYQVFQEISEAIDELIMPGFEILIFGDFNFQENIEKPNPLSSYLKYLGLKQIITDPTFALGHNTIDHVYMRPSLENIITVSYRFNYYTDHCSFNLSIK